MRGRIVSAYKKIKEAHLESQYYGIVAFLYTGSQR